MEKVETLDSLKKQSDEIWKLMVSPNGQSVAISLENKKVELWNIDSKYPSHILKGNSYKVFALAFSPNKKLLATGGGIGRPGGTRLYSDKPRRDGNARHT